MPCVEIVAVASVVLYGKVPLSARVSVTRPLFSYITITYPLSAVMKTKATSLPLAACAAALRSVSLSEDETVVSSVLARVVIASTG